MIYYTVYKVTNKINGKFYIGSHKTKDLNDSYMGSGKYLKYSQAKHGIENFEKEILFVFDTPEQMYAKEAEIVNKDFLAEENTYNLKVGGFGGFDYIQQVRTKEQQTEISRLGGLAPAKDPESLSKKISAGVASAWERGAYGHSNNARFAGKAHTEETKRKMSTTAKGRNCGKDNSQFGTMWITNGVDSKKIDKTNTIPGDWRRGRKIK